MFSLQRSEMFMATSRTPEVLAPLGAKPGTRILGRGRDCAPTELGSNEKDCQAINISPLWGKATNGFQMNSS